MRATYALHSWEPANFVADATSMRYSSSFVVAPAVVPTSLWLSLEHRFVLQLLLRLLTYDAFCWSMSCRRDPTTSDKRSKQRASRCDDASCARCGRSRSSGMTSRNVTENVIDLLASGFGSHISVIQIHRAVHFKQEYMSSTAFHVVPTGTRTRHSKTPFDHGDPRLAATPLDSVPSGRNSTVHYCTDGSW